MNVPVGSKGFDTRQRASLGSEVRLCLHRIFASPSFRDSLRLTRFLSFVVEETLSGRADGIKAYTVAIEALGRSTDFDPQKDPIVRVEAGRLRQALARYYAELGFDDPVAIELPRGTYVPMFRRREARRGNTISHAHAVARARRSVRLPPDGDADPLNSSLQQLVKLCEVIPALVGRAQSPARDTRREAEHVPRVDAALLLGPKAEAPADRNVAPSAAEQRTALAFGLISTLDELSAQLLAAPNLKSAVESILAAVMRLHRSDFGNVQLLDRHSNELVIYAARGFDEKFLKAFARVSASDGSSCARALRCRAPVIVADVLQDADFAPYGGVAAEAGFRAMQSTPLITSCGSVVGVVSTHFSQPHVPSPLDMLMTQFYGRLAADIVDRLAPA